LENNLVVDPEVKAAFSPFKKNYALYADKEVITASIL
jgi:hypothetical protein